MKTKTFELKYTECKSGSDTGVIIAAAGSSSRMQGTDKLFSVLCGKPVILRTLEAFQNHSGIKNIVVVTRKESINIIQNLVSENSLDKVTDIIEGGATRFSSVKKGFIRLVADKTIKNVLIHDGARPLVSAQVIDRVIDGVNEFSSAAAGVSLKDAVKITGKLGKIEKNVDRVSLTAMQTPQGFECQKYALALEKAEQSGKNFVDDCEVMENAGYTVYAVKGDYKNIKITTPEDLTVASAFLEEIE